MNPSTAMAGRSRAEPFRITGVMPAGRFVISLVVILQPQVGNQRLTFQVPERVFQLHQLDEKIVLRVEAGSSHGRFEVEAEPLLDSKSLKLLAALRQVKEEHQVKDDRRCQDGIAAQKIDLNLHGITEPA